jgi:peptidoglycan/xylan/chitin deacetylase (PgdA/CDA1 family)
MDMGRSSTKARRETQGGMRAMADAVVLHGITGEPGSRLERLLGDGLRAVAPLRGVGGCLERVVAAVSGPGGNAPVDGLGGAAAPEAAAVRLRAEGAKLSWGPPERAHGLGDLLRRSRDRGRSSVELIRSDPALLSGMQVGAWFDAPWRSRLLRRAPRPLRRLVTLPAPVSSRWLLAAADVSFWEGVRDACSDEEWRRLAGSSYVALVYHRFAGEGKPGQERIDVSPRRFARQLKALRLAGFRPLAPEQLLAFHEGASDSLPPRAVAITVDDAIADCVPALRSRGAWRPQLFAPTAELGGRAHWIDGEPVAGWDDLRSLEKEGVAIGSHGRRHRRLSELDADERRQELGGSLADLRSELRSPLSMVAYPNGDHDVQVCRDARAAGYRAAYTTEKGRNGAGADRFALRRVSVHAADGAAAVLWKAQTGEALPGWWLRLRRGRPSAAQAR